MHVKAPATIPYFLKEQIRELIIDGTYRPGQPLREQELEQRFGTSRSPIREAMRLLELSGMVVHVQRKGFRVRRYSATEIRHIYDLRAELAAYSWKQLSQDDVAELLPQLQACDRAIAKAHAREDVREFADGLREFYLSSVRRTGNQPLADTLERLFEQVEPMRFLFLRQNLSELPHDAFHRDVLLALEAGKQHDAAQAARAHALGDLDTIIAAYEAAATEGEARA